MTSEPRPEPSAPTSEIVGPLQSKVAEPNRIDWQNTDWDAWAAGMDMPLSGEEFPLPGDTTLYDFGMNLVCKSTEEIAFPATDELHTDATPIYGVPSLDI